MEDGLSLVNGVNVRQLVVAAHRREKEVVLILPLCMVEQNAKDQKQSHENATRVLVQVSKI